MPHAPGTPQAEQGYTRVGFDDGSFVDMPLSAFDGLREHLVSGKHPIFDIESWHGQDYVFVVGKINFLCRMPREALKRADAHSEIQAAFDKERALMSGDDA